MGGCTFALSSDDLVNNRLESDIFIPAANGNYNENTPATQGHLKEPTSEN